MLAVLAGVLGVAAFLLAEAWGFDAGLIALLLLVLVLGGCVLAGFFVGAGHPARARWLMAAWTPALLLGLGAVGGLGIELAVQLTPGDDASARTKAVYAAVGAIVVGVIAAVNGWADKHRSPWLARRVICWRYGPLFPCLPQGDGVGRRATEALTPVCGSASAPLVNGAAVQALLENIKAAVDAGEYSGGDNWSC
jgi:hypothetical protein